MFRKLITMLNSKITIDKLDDIEKRLILSDVKIIGKDKTKGYLYADRFILHAEADCLILCFHVSMPPEHAAVTTILIKETIKRIPLYIGDVYFGDMRTGNCYFGEEAHEMYDKERIKKYMAKYFEEQINNDCIMMNDKSCGHC